MIRNFTIPGAYTNIRVFQTFSRPSSSTLISGSGGAGSAGAGGTGGGTVATPPPPAPTFPSTIAALPPFAVDITTGTKPGAIYGPSDGSTPIVIEFRGLTVDPSLGMLGYPPAGKYYVALGPGAGLAWYDETGTVAGGFSDGVSPGLWSGQCYAGAHLQGTGTDPSTWTCAIVF